MGAARRSSGVGRCNSPRRRRRYSRMESAVDSTHLEHQLQLEHQLHLESTLDNHPATLEPICDQTPYSAMDAAAQLGAHDTNTLGAHDTNTLGAHAAYSLGAHTTYSLGVHA